MDNLKAWIETGLRSMKLIQDKDIELLTFAVAPQGLSIQDWEAKDTVKIQIKYKRGVQVKDFG
jgi:hypothetical protein